MQRATRRVTLPLLTVVVVATTACGPADPATTLRRLPSGRDIQVLSVGMVEGRQSAWSLEYRTHIPISDRKALQCEVATLWLEVRDEADRADAREARIWPNNFSRVLKFDGWRPVVLSHISTSFSLRKNENGVWETAGGWAETGC